MVLKTSMPTQINHLSMSPPANRHAGENGWELATITLLMLVIVVVFGSLLCLLWRKKRKASNERKKEEILHGLVTLHDRNDLGGFGNYEGMMHQVKLLDYDSIVAATNNFSSQNKLGQGGFGSVYKGKLLPEGKEIAVKRLSRESRQGIVELQNEIIVLIANLQHMNVVSLLGCCIKGDEKMLIYEYMTNKSLDFFLFDPTRRGLLDWKKRFNIIEGIAQGLLYLHRFSRLRIIHRDLKASNILLDDNMIPKISDFGLARIFDRTQSEANTSNIAGTFGYMSPEYVRSGILSDKSDVYSFGVLTLEIVSGQQQNSLCVNASPANQLATFAWGLWKEGTCLKMVDPTLMGDLYLSSDGMLRCIRVGLLCVQGNPQDRPTISEAISMLTKVDTIPNPKSPAYFPRTSDYVDNQANVGVHDEIQGSGSSVYVSATDE